MLALLIDPVVILVEVEQAPVVEVSVEETVVVESVVEGGRYGRWIGLPVVG